MSSLFPPPLLLLTAWREIRMKGFERKKDAQEKEIKATVMISILALSFSL